MNRFIVALVLVLTSSFSLAQAGGTPDSGAKANAGPNPARAARLQNDLGLTDEQVKKMREIRDSGGTREEMRAVLTPEQRVKAAQMRKENMAGHEEHKAAMQKELGLSNEQQAKLDEIRKNHGTRAQMRAVLTPEQQAKFDAMRSEREGMGPKPGGWHAKPSATTPSAAAPSASPASAAKPAAGSSTQPE